MYGNVSDDLAHVWSLGEIRDTLDSQVVIYENAVSYSSKQEKPRYKNNGTPFKSPM
jgi:hypothetical protein